MMTAGADPQVMAREPHTRRWRACPRSLSIYCAVQGATDPMDRAR